MRSIFALGIDPGVTTGVGLVLLQGDEIKLIQYAHFGETNRPSNGQTAFDVLVGVRKMVKNACIIGLEGQFIPSKAGKGQLRRSHAVSALTTARHAGGWLYLSQLLEWALWRGDVIAPNTWRQVIYGPHRVRKAAEYETLCRKEVANRFRRPVENEHSCEAILIATYVAEMIRRGAR